MISDLGAAGTSPNYQAIYINGLFETVLLSMRVLSCIKLVRAQKGGGKKGTCQFESHSLSFYN